MDFIQHPFLAFCATPEFVLQCVIIATTDKNTQGNGWGEPQNPGIDCNTQSGIIFTSLFDIVVSVGTFETVVMYY